MIKVNPDFSRATYLYMFNSWLSPFLPLIRKVLLKINKPSFKIFKYDVTSWSCLQEDGASYHLLIRKGSEWAYRADYQRTKI